LIMHPVSFILGLLLGLMGLLMFWFLLKSLEAWAEWRRES